MMKRYQPRACIQSATFLHGEKGRRIIRNPSDGSYTCLERWDGKWHARSFGVSEEEADSFLHGDNIIQQRT